MLSCAEASPIVIICLPRYMPVVLEPHAGDEQDTPLELVGIGLELTHFFAASLAGWLMELELAGRIATVSGGYEQLKGGS